MSIRRLLQRCGGQSGYEIVRTSDNDEESDSKFDSFTVELHSRFEKVDYLPNLNLRKVDHEVKTFLASFNEKGIEKVLDEKIPVKFDDFDGAVFHQSKESGWRLESKDGAEVDCFGDGVLSQWPASENKRSGWLFESKNGAKILCTTIEVDHRVFLLFNRQKAFYIPFLEGGKLKYLFMREKSGWFKLSDDKKETKRICFARNVDPDCQPFKLQLLLRRMDSKLLEGLSPPAGTEEQRLIDKFDRQTAINRTVFLKESKADGHAPGRSSIFGGKSTTDDGILAGRPVYFVTVGQMNSSRIRLKGDALYKNKPSLLNVVQEKKGKVHPLLYKIAKKVLGSAALTVDGKEIWVKRDVLDRIKASTGDKSAKQRAEDVLSKQFVDKDKAMRFASKHITDFKKDDEYFEVVEEVCPALVSKVVDCLVVLAKAAKKNGAAFVIPDYMTSSGNSALIEKALDHAEFSGPVINVCREEQIALDEATARRTYEIKDSNSVFPTGILHSRATHSILVPHAGYSGILAKLANVISEPDPSIFTEQCSGDDDPVARKRCKRVMIVAGGGVAVMEHIAAAVKENIPIIVLRGSRRLSDNLPKIWVHRFSHSLDTYDETKKFCMACGFADNDPKLIGTMTLWMQEILERGHINTHPLSTGTHAFSRILRSLEIKDDALLQGMVRYCEYRSAMRSMEGPDKRMLFLKLLVGVSTTVVSTVAGAVMLPGRIDKIIMGDVPFQDLTYLEVVIVVGMVVLPGILSVIVSLQQDYNYTPKILALTYAAALLEGEMFRYRACSGKYSDEYIINHRLDDPTTNDDNVIKLGAGEEEIQAMESDEISDGADKDHDHGLVDDDSDCYDTLSIRARWFTERLIKIGEKVPIFDCPDPDQAGPSMDEVERFSIRKLFTKRKTSKGPGKNYDFVHLPKVLEKLKKLRGVKEIADDSLEEWVSEVRYGTLSGSDYANLRLKGFLKRFEDEADKLETRLFWYKIAVYGIGVAGGIMSLTGFEAWLAVSTAVLSSLTAYNAYSPMETRVQMLRGAVFALEDISTQWKDSRPSDDKVHNKRRDKHMSSCRHRRDIEALTKQKHWKPVAVPEELRMQQRYKDLLIENTEKVLLTVNPTPPDFTREGDTPNHIFPSPYQIAKEKAEKEAKSKKREEEEKASLAAKEAKSKKKAEEVVDQEKNKKEDKKPEDKKPQSS